MNRLFTILLLAALAVSVRADDDDQHVIDLTDDNFDEILKDNEHILVKFYAPWCGHCKALAPEYEKAAKMLEEEGSKIKLAKLDATKFPDLGSRFKVQGYPTLKFFRAGVETEYTGSRQADGIVSWLKKKTGPALTLIESTEDFDKLLKEQKIIGAIFAKDDSSKEYKAVEDLAKASDAIVFIHVKNADLLKKHSASESPKFVILRQFDEPTVEYTGDFSKDDLSTFVAMERVALVTEFNQETSQSVFESVLKVHVIAFSAKSHANYEQHMKVLTDTAKAMKGKLHVVLINFDDEENKRVAEYFSVTMDDTPTFRVLNLAKDDMTKYKPSSNDFTTEYLIKYTQDVLDGKVKPHLKSEEESSSWDSEPVKVLVANTFADRAVTKDKAVFVEFYAPWCGHCKALEPIWVELGTHFADNKEVMIAKCDSTANEFEDIKVESFPTIKFSPKGSVQWIDYHGERTKEALIKYVESNGKEEAEDKEASKAKDEL